METPISVGGFVFGILEIHDFNVANVALEKCQAYVALYIASFLHTMCNVAPPSEFAVGS